MTLKKTPSRDDLSNEKPHFELTNGRINIVSCVWVISHHDLWVFDLLQKCTHIPSH